MEHLPPFAYLKEVIDRVRNDGVEGKTKTSRKAGQCSTYVSLSTPSGKNIEQKSSLNSAIVEFLQSISFPQNEKLSILETS
jgi:hypothetical protein